MQSARQTSGLKRLKLLLTTALGNWGSDQVFVKDPNRTGRCRHNPWEEGSSDDLEQSVAHGSVQGTRLHCRPDPSWGKPRNPAPGRSPPGPRPNLQTWGASPQAPRGRGAAEGAAGPSCAAPRCPGGCGPGRRRGRRPRRPSAAPGHAAVACAGPCFRGSGQAK